LLGTTDLSFPGFRACYSEAGTTSLVEVIRPVEAITAQRFSSPACNSSLENVCASRNVRLTAKIRRPACSAMGCQNPRAPIPLHPSLNRIS
jgi:hypothetical protein